MIQLCLLGAPRIEGATPEDLGRVTQPRPIALLSILAVAGERGITRDRAMVLLWGDCDEGRARHHLSDALYIVRHALGPQAVESPATTLILNGRVVSSDLEAFSRAMEQGRFVDAVARYGGPFLDGFHLAGAAHFEDWMIAKRQHLIHQVCEALEGLANEAEQRGDLSAAIGWWRRLLEQDAYNSRVALALARALLANEDRGNALDVLEAHRQLLRSELNADTGVTVRSLMNELRNGNSEETVTAAVRPKPERAEPAVLPRPRRWTWKLRASHLGLLLLAALVGSALTWRFTGRRWDGPVDQQLLAVFPFHAMSASPAIERLAVDVPDLFWATITGEFGLRIADPTALELEWRKHGGQPDHPLALDRTLQLAQSAGAGLVVLGTVAGTDSLVRLSASLLGVPDGDLRVPPTVVEGEYRQFPILIDRLIAQLLARHVGVPEHRIEALAGHPSAAVQAYLSGMRAGQQNTGGAEWFARALDGDPDLLLAALSGYEAGEASQQMAQIVWDHRGDLHPYDAALALPLLGWRFGQTATVAERLAQYGALTRSTPPWSAPLHEWAVTTFVWGRATCLRNWASVARAANENLVGRDPNHLGAWFRLFALATFEGDTAGAQRCAREYMTRGAQATGSRGLGWLLAWTVRLRLALLVHDEREVAALWAHSDDATRVAVSHPLGGAAIYASEVGPLVGGLLVDGRGLSQLDTFMRSLRAGDPTPSFPMLNWARVRGHGDEWREVRTALYAELPPVTAAGLRLRDALFLGSPEGREEEAAAAFLDRVARGVLTPPPDSTDPTPAVIGPARATCWSTLWSVMHGTTSGARDAIRTLRAMPLPYRYAVCAGMIEALATRLEGGDARPMVSALDSLVRQYPMEPWPYERGVRDLTPGIDNLMVARLLAEQGDSAQALAAIRRGPWGPVASERTPHWSLGMLPEFLREEGQLAAAVGDTAGAIHAYDRYLVLRAGTSGWASELDEVQQERQSLRPAAPATPVPVDRR